MARTTFAELHKHACPGDIIVVEGVWWSLLGRVDVVGENCVHFTKLTDFSKNDQPIIKTAGHSLSPHNMDREWPVNHDNTTGPYAYPIVTLWRNEQQVEIK